MPGIAGIIARDPGFDARAAVQQMVASMRHESFYTAGTNVNESLGVWAGWTAHAGSMADCLPIWNERKDICLLFAGEVFADQTEINRLAARGHSFQRGNASYLVHVYEEGSASFFPKLNGVFSGLVVDLRENRVTLFNDRYGMGRIYCHEGADGFYFASEAKALLTLFPHLRCLDMQSFGEFFACGCVLQNRTLFPGITLLPAGSAWTFTPGRPVRKETYFDKREWENQAPLSVEDYYEKLKETFNIVLPRYFRDTERTAMSLTGGLDSRMIMAWLPSGPSKLQCYTHRGVFRECADARIARRVAEVCGQPHRVVTVAVNFSLSFPLLQGAPFI